MKKIVLGLALSTGIGMSNAQPALGYYQDALLFSQTSTSFGSTARIQSIGGAQTSLGGDLSSISSNPAGLGFFNRSVFSSSMALDVIAADTEYFGESESRSKTNFNLPNLGVVFNFPKSEYTNDRFKGGSLGISLSRSRSFHLNRSYRGANDFNSVVDAFIEAAGQTPPDELAGFELASFDQYLMDPAFDGNGDFIGYDLGTGSFPIQSETTEERGSQYQLNIAWGGNYNDRLYFGGGMGVQVLNYSRERDYLENEFVFFNDDGDGFLDPDLNAITILEELRVRGTGINFNGGIIVRPVNFITLGFSYTTPSFVSLDEESFFDLGADWNPGTIITETDADGISQDIDISTIDPFQSDLVISEYTLRSPSRLSIGATAFLGKSGFLSADIERVNYGAAQLTSRDFETAGDNELIEAFYRDVLNIRLGGEYRFGDFRLRGGYSIFPSPYEGASDLERNNVSLGFGYRNRDFFLDFSLINSRYEERYAPYFLGNDTPIATSDVQTTSIVATFGINF